MYAKLGTTLTGHRWLTFTCVRVPMTHLAPSLPVRKEAILLSSGGLWHHRAASIAFHLQRRGLCNYFSGARVNRSLCGLAGWLAGRLLPSQLRAMNDIHHDELATFRWEPFSQIICSLLGNIPEQVVNFCPHASEVLSSYRLALEHLYLFLLSSNGTIFITSL